MLEITPENAAPYLRAQGLATIDQRVDVQALGWGVSNVVMRANRQGQPPLVLKQSREQLRTKAAWFSRLDRIWTETAALRMLETVVGTGIVPRVVFEDRENYLFAMSCAPDESVVWKEQLLAGEADPNVAAQAGQILAAFHTVRPSPASPLGDREVFDQLRIDPFYRWILPAHPKLSDAIDHLITSMTIADPRFVHADFSPKNILVHTQGLTIVDFETAHLGDPAFDLGFFLSHLVLKALMATPDHERYLDLTRAFWTAYGSGDRELIARSIQHTAACGLARVDGKSPVDYLDEPRREATRVMMTRALLDPPQHWSDFLDLFIRTLPG